MASDIPYLAERLAAGETVQLSADISLRPDCVVDERESQKHLLREIARVTEGLRKEGNAILIQARELKVGKK